jgi:hypothetical protein
VTTDGVLHLGGEVLHAHRQPVEPEGSQQLQLVAARDSRIDFDGRFSVGVNAELPRDDAVEALDLREAQICRRSASPMMLDDRSASLQPVGQHLDFTFEVLQIASGDLVLARNDGHAAAVSAPGLAKRQVNV